MAIFVQVIRYLFAILFSTIGYILWTTLGVAERFDKITLMIQSFS